MIDLKTIKNITIAEGSVKKITNSSGVVLWEVKSTSEQAPCYYVAENVSDLPQSLYQAEYAQIGIQKFLITDYHWTVNSKAVVEFEINSYTNEFGRYARILGIEGESWDSSYQSTWDVENTVWCTKPFGSMSSISSTVVPNLNQKCVGQYSETGLTIDGTVITATTPSTSITANTSHYVCIGGYNTTAPAEYLDGKIYSVKIYESGTLVRDIVVLTNGLFYDKLSKKVYAAGAGGVCETGGTSTLLVKNEPKYDMAYITSEKCWYALNNNFKWEKYGVIEAVSSLDNLTAYDGKLVINKTDMHEYKYTNNAWTDQGEASESVVKNYWAECKQDQIELYHISYHWGEGYHVEFESAYNSTRSTNYKIFLACQFDNGTHGPIEIGEGTDSYYYDQHYPTSTTSNACDTLDYSNRKWIYSAHNANTRYRLKVWNNKIEQHKYDDDSLVTSSPVPWTTHSWYNGLYEIGLFTANSNLIWHAARFYDSDNNLTDEWLVQSDGSIKETLTQTVVQPQSTATGVTVSEYGNMTAYTYPVSYEQYDAPNLNYTECANEAAMKTLSCPYEGMKVKLTDTGKKYKFTYNSTLVKYEWVEITSNLDVDLHNQWVASTKTLPGYNVYMSNSNHNVDSGYASMKFKFEGMPDFKLWINSYAESSFDYTIAWNMDVDYPSSNPSDSTTGVKAHTRGNQKDPTTISNFTEVDYPNDCGEHFVVITYRKDSSGSYGDDRGYVAVKLTPLSTTWVVSSTEFVKKDGKYYQRINEVGTYEGGVTANTGNYKEGNELTVIYKQGSADDYILVGSGMYYKKYAYVTPKDQEINTGDYIQGDYIGEATPSMKVTYVDNTEKTFYNLTSIEENTVSNKSNAKSVEIYDGVTSIGQYTFFGCSSLTSVTIPDSVTSIGNNTFYGCSSLTGITIPSGVTSIKRFTFFGCSSLTGITIPSGVTSIETYAFYNCSFLATVTIQNSTSKLVYNNNAFANISSSAKLYVPSNLLSDYQSYTSWTGAFKGGIYAIPSMKVTYIDGTEKVFTGLSIIKGNTDPNIKNAKNVVIHDGVRLDEGAFNLCSNLESIKLPNDLTEIHTLTFQYCSSLTGITIPTSVTRIGDSAFRGCTGLTSIIIPNSVTEIGWQTFQECSSLASIIIPANVASIGSYVFDGCSSLSSVTIQNSTSKFNYGTDKFKGISSNAKLYVPSNLFAEYQADSKWTGAFGGGIYAIS